MNLDWKAIDAITAADLQALVDDQVMERKAIEYKSALPGKSDGDRKEFLYDASAFANTQGGHLVFGMREVQGVPQELVGVVGVDPDREKLRLENMLRDGVKPRIQGIGLAAIRLSEDKHAFVVRLPRSWAAPHMVTYQDASRFYRRNSSGKYLLDVGEIRSAFAMSEHVISAARSFRDERLSAILAQKTPRPLLAGPYVILHLVPFSATEPGARIDVVAADDLLEHTMLLEGQETHRRFNFEGLITAYGENDPKGRVASYIQILRRGMIESVGRCPVVKVEADVWGIDGPRFEAVVLDAVGKYLALLEKLGTGPPSAVFLSLHGVAGYRVFPDRRRHERRFLSPELMERIAETHLVLDEVLVEGRTTDLARALRPAFDTIWNAAGWPAAPA